MKDWESSDEEIRCAVAKMCDVDIDVEDADRAIGKAYQRKLVEWSEEICSDETHNNLAHHTIRRHCPVCWQELLDDLGVN